ncbi:head GIN domain-containing protein [Ichthyenterobacterium magnum]|uniref:Putative autotransporter adhesin-like protein n=1 Tax=Ichthyenterobacterium magnum TaxID=1230530 RepID=A0A420DKE0_9FLAO|nr:head GIN domain-containing protein [Ichthyenterobacterium magnum]RKE94720.1 putative autotransporter adhesin-like protein [Ichthyenterobacterium magnum]
MKKSILLLALTLMSINVSNAQIFGNKKIKGNGNVTTATRTTSDYNGIKCAGSMDYILVKGTEGKITIEGEENLLEYIITEVKNGNLIVKTKKNANLSPSWNKTIKITIPFQDIEKVSLAGSGDLWNEDKINASSFSVSLAGSGDVIINIDASSVKGSIAGSGDLTLKGTTNDLEAKVAGSGDFHGFGLEANNTTVSVAGSGDAQVVSNKTLKARVAGTGDINYKGNPDKKDTKVAGSGSISN